MEGKRKTEISYLCPCDERAVGFPKTRALGEAASNGIEATKN